MVTAQELSDNLASNTGSSLVGWIGSDPTSQMRALQDKMRDLPVHLRDYVTIYASRAESDQHDQSAGFQRAVDHAASTQRHLEGGLAGWVSITGIVLRHNSRMRLMNLSHLPGATGPMFTTAPGVIQNLFWQDMLLFGNGGGRDERPWLFHSVNDASGQSGVWYSGMDGVIATGFGGAPWWRAGHNADGSYTAFHQFITMTRMQCFRPNAGQPAIDSPAMLMTGLCGQFHIPRGNLFDNCDLSTGVGPTGTYAPGACVVASCEYTASDATAGSYADTLTSPGRGWTRAGPGAPGQLFLQATVQHSDYGIVLEGVAPVKVCGDLEATRIGVTVAGATKLTFEEADCRNAAGSPTSAGTGALLMAMDSNVEALFGKNNIVGTYIDRTYVTVPGANPVLFDASAPDFSDADLSVIPSSVTLNSAVAGGVLTVAKRSHVLLTGADGTNFAISSIASRHVVGARVAVFTDYNVSATFNTAYQNLVTPDLRPFVLGPEAGVEMMLTDFRGGTWRLIARA